MTAGTCDLCDRHPARVRVVEPLFRDFGGCRAFGGRIATIKCHEDNSLVRDLVAEPGRGRVLVVDGGGSLRRSLLGDQLAAKAVANGWEGIIVYGAVRDVAALAQLELGIKAIGVIPLKTEKRGIGDRDVVLRFAGVDFVPGEFLYADGDGVIVAATALTVD